MGWRAHQQIGRITSGCRWLVPSCAGSVRSRPTLPASLGGMGGALNSPAATAGLSVDGAHLWAERLLSRLVEDHPRPSVPGIVYRSGLAWVSAHLRPLSRARAAVAEPAIPNEPFSRLLGLLRTGCDRLRTSHCSLGFSVARSADHDRLINFSLTAAWSRSMHGRSTVAVGA